jgi:hypothetical protein
VNPVNYSTASGTLERSISTVRLHSCGRFFSQKFHEKVAVSVEDFLARRAEKVLAYLRQVHGRVPEGLGDEVADLPGGRARRAQALGRPARPA